MVHQRYCQHILLRFFLQPRITASRGNRLDMAAPATPRIVQWCPCVTKWHTYDATAPPARRLSQVSRKATGGNRSKEMTSRPPPEPSCNQQSHKLFSRWRTSARSSSVQRGVWISSWHGWKQTPSAWWGGGGATRLSTTSTQRQRVSSWAYWPRCFSMEPTR